MSESSVRVLEADYLCSSELGQLLSLCLCFYRSSCACGERSCAGWCRRPLDVFLEDFGRFLLGLFVSLEDLTTMISVSCFSPTAV